MEKIGFIPNSHKIPKCAGVDRPGPYRIRLQIGMILVRTVFPQIGYLDFGNNKICDVILSSYFSGVIFM